MTRFTGRRPCPKGHTGCAWPAQQRVASSLLSARSAPRPRGPALRTLLLRRALPVALLLGVVTVPAIPATAQDECLPAGGMDGDPPISQVQVEEEDPDWEREVASARLDPVEPDAHDVVFTGGGWGHGIGLSQYAAQGAATLGCSAAEIITTHFPDTAIETRDSRSSLRLKVWTTGETGTTSAWVEQDTNWRTCTQDDSGAVLDCSKLVTQPAGSSVTVSLTAEGWRLQGGGLDETVANRTHSILQLMHDGRLVRVRQGAPATATDGLPIRYGRFELDYTGQNGGRLFATEIVNAKSHPDLSPIDTYLLGLAEVPFSWKPAALQSQVLAARSYAEATARNRSSYTDAQRIQVLDCRCDLRVDTGDQVWAGATKQMAEPTYYPNWVDAVTATANQYVVKDGAVLTTFYSSSHGGMSRAGFSHTDSNYARVDTSRWERASGNGRYRWSQGFSRAELQAAFGIDDIDGITVLETDDAGYPMPNSIEVTGVDDGEQVTRTFDPYQQVRSRLGLFSPRFTISTVTDLADDDQIPVARLDGETRIDTAIRLSADGWSDGADTVVLARADNPADALTGSSLAGTHDAPLLLTAQDHLSEAVSLELQRLKPDRVLLLGGPVALDRAVADDVRTLGIPEVRRVSGETRFGTAVDVATQVARGDESTAYLVRLRDVENPSRSWVDALSVAGVAARKGAAGTGWPILGTDAELPAETKQAITDLGITRVVPVGGPLVVSDAVLEELAGMGVEVADRLAGEDRYGTSRAVTASDDVPTQSLAIATAQNFPDGLAAGPWAARTGTGLLLVPTELADGAPWREGEHPAFIAGLGWAEPQLFAVGGPVAIETPVISRVASLLEDARPATE